VFSVYFIDIDFIFDDYFAGIDSGTFSATLPHRQGIDSGTIFSNTTSSSKGARLGGLNHQYLRHQLHLRLRLLNHVSITRDSLSTLSTSTQGASPQTLNKRGYGPIELKSRPVLWPKERGLIIIREHLKGTFYEPNMECS
jgi:hypothetical protein